MQEAQAFRAKSMVDLAAQVTQFFVDNAAAVGVSLSVVPEGGAFAAILMFTP